MAISTDKVILITNPGSSSRKYALYRGQTALKTFHYEYENGAIVLNGEPTNLKNLTETVSHLKSQIETPDLIVARIACPGDYFTENHLVDQDFLNKLEAAKTKAPLHVPVAASEIESLHNIFTTTDIVAVSDSRFQWQTKPDYARYYAFDTDLADRYEIKRYGYHGLSVAGSVATLKEQNLLPEKLVVAHIGSGSSVSAIKNGQSVDNSMGYSPLEGVMMATRTGDIDPTAAFAIAKAKNLSNQDLEIYLNKQSGLLGTSGSTDDMREIIALKEQGDQKAKLAYELYISRITLHIGRAAAALCGVDALVFTATIGERNSQIRQDIIENLVYLGFSLDQAKNQAQTPNIAAPGGKPIYIIKADETRQMVKEALEFIQIAK